MTFNCECPSAHATLISALSKPAGSGNFRVNCFSMSMDGGFIYAACPVSSSSSSGPHYILKYPWPDLSSYEIINSNITVPSFMTLANNGYLYWITQNPSSSEHLIKRVSISPEAAEEIIVTLPTDSAVNNWGLQYYNGHLYLGSQRSFNPPGPGPWSFVSGVFEIDLSDHSYTFYEYNSGPDDSADHYLYWYYETALATDGAIWFPTVNHPSAPDGLSLARFDTTMKTFGDVIGEPLDLMVAPARDGKVFGYNYNTNEIVIVNPDLTVTANGCTITPDTLYHNGSNMQSEDFLIQVYMANANTFMVRECEPPIPSFVNKFNGLTSSLFAGSKTEQGDSDGPALDARFTGLTDTAFTWDSIQRKQLNVGNRFCVVDNSKIKLIHSCEDSISLPPPCPVYVGDMGFYATSMALAGNTIYYVRYISGTPRLFSMSTTFTAQTELANDIYSVAVDDSGELFFTRPNGTTLLGGNPAAPTTLATFSSAAYRKIVWSNGLVYSCGNPASLGYVGVLEKVDPLTGVVIEVASGLDTDPASVPIPVATPDGAIWFTHGSTGSTVYRLDPVSDVLDSVTAHHYIGLAPRGDNSVFYNHASELLPYVVNPDLSQSPMSCVIENLDGAIYTSTRDPATGNVLFSGSSTGSHLWGITLS